MYGRSSLQMSLSIRRAARVRVLLAINQNESVNSFYHLDHQINSELSNYYKGRNNFIGQINNTPSYFRSLDSLVQHKLFQSYCASYYGCELRLLNIPKLEDSCVAWR